MRSPLWAVLLSVLPSAFAWATACQHPADLVQIGRIEPTRAPKPISQTKVGKTVARNATESDLLAALQYVKSGWTLLERTPQHLARIAHDPKFPTSGGKPLIYLPEREGGTQLLRVLGTQIPAAELSRIEFMELPAPEPFPIPEPVRPGLLYLPRPYVVPGGRFNEMYGWDSYFIVRGLLRDGELERARAMVENFVYEIENYGTVLNANRSYYLSRSQPPLLTSMILEVHAKLGDLTWLRTVSAAISAYHAYFVRVPHLTPETGLSRYYDLGKGPATETLFGERDEQGRTHYDRVRVWFRAQPSNQVARFYDRERDALTESYYLADRSMRESGFDPSDRFGPFNSGVVDYNPVCLNSLLYRMETEAATIHRLLSDDAESSKWTQAAALRARAMQRYLWQPVQGLFLDYDVVHASHRDYLFATAFYPLWVGIASAEQAARIIERALHGLEAPGGVLTSAHRSGNQWDAPFGWAPLQLIAVEGLRRYGYRDQADRISINFVSLILKEFVEHHAIFEKYDVERRQSDVSQGIRFGYSSNEIGFGWTNAAFVTLLDALPLERRSEVLRLAGAAIPALAARAHP